MRPAVVCLWLLSLSTCGWGAERIDYARDIKPILTMHCQSCHGALAQKGGLRLDAIQFVRKGGEAGPGFVAGKPDDSLLLDAVLGNGMERMPLEGAPLSAEQIAKLKAWVEQGGTGPTEEAVPADPRQHWSYQKPVLPSLPSVIHDGWVSNPIDAFIVAEYEKRGLQPVPETGKAHLLRRVSIDLIGLPPTREELHAFLNDRSPHAYEKVVDRLLDSPHYGERWGRHWMDVWRYSDWDGYGQEVRNSHPHIWRWRDWIIESLNKDRGYDTMVREMLAGDELAPDDPQTLRATGYLVRSWYKFNRNVWLDQTVEHTAKAFLGMTLNCAKCHDHMYDPVAQSEYYQFRAFFEAHDIRIEPFRKAGGATAGDMVRVFDAHPDTKTFLFRRGDDKQPDDKHPLLAAVPTVFHVEHSEIKKVPLTPEQFYPELTAERFDAQLQNVRKELEKAQQELSQKETELRQLRTTEVDSPSVQSCKDQCELRQKKVQAQEAKFQSLLVRAAAERAKYLTPILPDKSGLNKAAALAEKQEQLAEAEFKELEARLAVKGVGAPKDDAAKKKLADAEKKLKEAEQKREAAQKGLANPGESYAALGTVYPQASTGRRTKLAEWITSPENPRTARVAVNHLWLRHFGTPLVPTVFDFGVNGKPPTHPALLDWLALELQRGGWRMKRLHRLIVTSRVYRQQSNAAVDDPNQKLDPENTYLWRMNPHRMEAEIVRDATLAVSGELDRTLYGADIAPQEWTKFPRRSIYFRTTLEKRMTFLALFDSANPLECYKRNESIVPQQALALANSALSLQQSRVLAKRINAEAGAAAESDAAFVEIAFETLLARGPSPDERNECLKFLRDQTALLANGTKLQPIVSGETSPVPPAAEPGLRAREDLILVLMNHNDFVTVR
ncbi:MAG: DUF1553 domain-containing protein [Planctomycetales bacterium]